MDGARGHSAAPVTVVWQCGQSLLAPPPLPSTLPPPSAAAPDVSADDYESVVLTRLRQEAERRRLCSQLQREGEGEDGSHDDG